MTDNTNTINRIIRAKSVANTLSVSQTTVWNWCNPKSRHYRPDFPKPFKVTERVTGWLESDISAYVEQLAQQSKGATA